jgi:hypothetical protein
LGSSAVRSSGGPSSLGECGQKKSLLQVGSARLNPRIFKDISLARPTIRVMEHEEGITHHVETLFKLRVGPIMQDHVATTLGLAAMHYTDHQNVLHVTVNVPDKLHLKVKPIIWSDLPRDGIGLINEMAGLL